MQTRKIALHRFSIIALVLALLVLGSALAVAGDSSAISPQMGEVNYTATLYLGNSPIGPASNTLTTVNVSTLNGVFIQSYNGATNNFNLPYGSYVFTTAPYVSQSGTTPIIANGTSQIVNVTSSSQSVNIHIKVYEAQSTSVSVNTITPGSSAAVSFSTPDGFVFASGNVNSTNNNLTVNLPNGGFFANVVYGGKTFNYYEPSLPAKGPLYLNFTSGNFFGYVTDYSTGKAISDFKIVDINLTSNTYSVLPFTGGSYHIASLGGNNNVYTLVANGYEPKNITQPTSPSTAQINFQLNKSSSNVYYDYSIATNPYYLNLTVNFQITNSTTLSFLGNSSVGSYYWQYYFDNLGGASSQKAVNNYLSNMLGRYTNNSIWVAGYNYNETGYGSIHVTNSPKGLIGLAYYNYTNPDIKASDLSSGFQVKLYTTGTQYLPGAFYSTYNISYNEPGVSLSSPLSAASTFKSPVSIMPQAASGFLTLTFKPVLKPTLTASDIKLYWNNGAPTNYLVASNSTSAAFLAPIGVPVSLNVSGGFYNPVTGANDYQNALSWKWSINGSTPVSGSYNATETFKGEGNYTVAVNYTSSAGAYNVTTFTVYAFNGTPTASLNVTSGGKTLFPTATVSNVASLTVPQSKVVQFSGYYSSLKIPGSSYNAPLIYSWYFPGFANNAVNITQTFNTPYIASKAMVVGYLNVSTAVGKVASTQLSIKVNDTTAPSAQVTVQNVTHATLAQPIAGQITIFSANKSTDKYYSTSDLSYNWSIVYANGTKVPAGNSTYQLIGNNTNQSYLMVQFNTLNSLIVSLKVTNPSNVSSYSNFTTSMVVVSPRLVVLNAYFPTTPEQGSKTVVYLNVSNNGTVNANSFYIVAIVNGKIVNNQSYGPLPVGTTKQFEFNFTSPAQGNVQVQFEALNSTQPAFFAKGGSLTVTQKVSPPAYQTPLIVGGVIAIIIVIGVVYYRLSSRTVSKPKEKKQVPAKKTEEKKK